MAKANLIPNGGGGEFGTPIRHNKYHFVKSDFNTLDELFFRDSSNLGVAFKAHQNKVDILATVFKTGVTRSGIISEPHFSTAKRDVAFGAGEMDGFDFAFLDKVQLQWLLEMMEEDDRLCLADCWIDLADTPPYTKRENDNKLYLAFKLWIEKDERTWKLAKARGLTDDFPSFTIIPPCPPVWPEIATYSNSYFAFRHRR